jgi:hypothetical protein
MISAERHRIWALTQAAIALLVIFALLVVAVVVLIRTDPTTVWLSPLAMSAFVLLSNMTNLILGFYFGRRYGENH